MTTRRVSTANPNRTPYNKSYRSHPINRVAVEIVVEIFQQVCPPPDPEAREMMSKRTPLFLGTICKEWREIAWSAPTLWKDVALHLDVSSNQLDILREWLSRAKDVPLNITLYQHRRRIEALYKEDVIRLGSDEAILTLLLTRARFWSTFRCDSLFPQLLDVFRKTRFPILKSIRVEAFRSYTVLGRRHTYKDSPPNAMLTASPSLEHLILQGYSFSKVLMPRNKQLKSLGVSLLPFEACVKILRVYSGLVYAHFTDVLVQQPATLNAISTLTMANLSHLQLSRFVSRQKLFLGNSDHLLESLELPALKSLHLNKLGSLSSVISLVKRSGCLLEILDLEIWPKAGDDLAAMFSALPMLTSFRWSCPGSRRKGLLTTKVINMLRPSYTDGSPLLPNLISFTWLDPVPDLAERPLAKMLKERWRVRDDKRGRPSAVAQLKSVKLPYFYCSSSLSKELFEVCREGLKLKFELTKPRGVN
ncbi:hypothetical protein CPC08DRAFT_768579 [Agrocybe pediades]|nr:hypothetical protein CPC08DRAFT_768579 [Agrocybe pediades]